MNIQGHFPEPFIFSEPDISKKEHREMLRYFEKCPLPQKDDLNYTGDVAGDDQVLSKRPFRPLLTHIKDTAKGLLKLITNKYEQYDIHIVKSWPVVLTKGSCVELHSHIGNTFSFVYYVQTEPGVGGDIAFQRPSNSSLLQIGFAGHDLSEAFSQAMAVFPARQNLMIMWPSPLRHCVSELQGDAPRYSLSGDIVITQKVGLQMENKLTNPDRWIKI